jgi:hypothetical protein
MTVAAKLSWEEIGTGFDGFHGYSGDIAVGTVLRRSIDGIIVWTAHDAVHMKWTAKANGQAKSFDTGKRAVERAWTRWLERACLTAKPTA